MEQTPWQLKMFSKSLKKRQKLRLLLQQIGNTKDKRCLLITNGDNNGALNYHFREHGGEWTWVENEPDHVEEMEQLLGEKILNGDFSAIPARDEEFDVVVSIDVHEHLDDCSAFNRELFRVTRPGGIVVVTTPNGDRKPVTVLKELVGMTREEYGHKVIGYNVTEHEQMLTGAGLEPIGAGSYSKFFTESLELLINFTYVKVLSRKRPIKEGTIAPSSHAQLRDVGKQYRAYAVVYPLLRAIASLDLLLTPFTGYAVSVVARKPT